MREVMLELIRLPGFVEIFFPALELIVTDFLLLIELLDVVRVLEVIPDHRLVVEREDILLEFLLDILWRGLDIMGVLDFDVCPILLRLGSFGVLDLLWELIDRVRALTVLRALPAFEGRWAFGAGFGAGADRFCWLALLD